MTIGLDALNALPAAGFTALLAKVFEDSAWVAERAAEARPYPTVEALHAGMMNAVRAAPEAERLAFLRGHPELGGQAARRRELGAHSTQEQAGLDLDRLEAAEAGRFDRMNEAYRTRFGFPFIVCVRRHTRASLIEAFERRLTNDVGREYQAAFDEIARITRLRLVELVEGPGLPVTSGSLTTHVLDTARARPAAGVGVQLFEVEGERLHRLTEGLTNEDGRLDRPLLSGGPLRMGRYELRFDVGGYFAASGQSGDFLDRVPIRFTISDAETHYHVPLLIAPGGYTTYRGS